MVDILEKNIQEIIRSSKIKTFGFIIYNNDNPNIVKLLRDEDYWNALNSISGEKFFIFAVKPKQGSIGYPDIPPGTMGMMIPVWKEPKENDQLLELFEIKSTQNLPLFFVFTKVGPYLLKHSIKIDESNVDSALSQLKKIFYKIDEVAKKVNADFEEPAQIHDAFAEILQKHNFFKNVSSLNTFFGAVKKYVTGF